MNTQYINKIIRACKLDVNLYEEVEADKTATLQAAGVVVLSSLAAGVGALSLGTSNFLMAPFSSETDIFNNGTGSTLRSTACPHW